MTNKITLPQVSDDDNATLNLLLEQLDQKRKRNLLRSAYYDMRHFQRFVGGVVPPQYYKLGIVLGWAGKAVDILARRCNLDGFVWPDSDLDALGLPALLEANNFYSELNQGLTSSLIHAVSFTVSTKGGVHEPPALLHFKDAMNATGVWNRRTRGLDSLLSVTARDDDCHPTGVALYLDGRTIEAVKDGPKWDVDISEHDWGVPADPLPYQPRLGREFGSSRISRAVMSLQDQATRTVIRLEAHSDIYAIPDLWMLGASSALFKNEDGSQKTPWQIMMGRIKGIPDDGEAESDALARADVKQFSASDPDPHLKALKQQAQLFSGETSIPLTSLGVSDMSNPTSADSYIASREDLIAEAEGATDDWSPGLRRSVLRTLAMANGESSIPESWLTIQPKWRSPIYLSRAAQADAGMKQISAAPWLADTEVGLELLGLDSQQIDRALADKRRRAGQTLLDKVSGQSMTAGEQAADEAKALQQKFEALGIAIRAGVAPQSAAKLIGLDGLTFTGAIPVTLRVPETQASRLEDA